MKSFYKQKEVAGELLQKKGLLLEQRALQDFVMQITSLVLTRKFQTDWFKIPLPGEAETAISLIIKFWFGDMTWQKWLHFFFFFFNSGFPYDKHQMLNDFSATQGQWP